MRGHSRIPGMRRGGTLFVLPAIDDNLDPAEKSALAIRNACAVEGRCPACGTVPELHFDAHGIGHLTFRHDDDCPCLRDDEVA